MSYKLFYENDMTYHNIKRKYELKNKPKIGDIIIPKEYDLDLLLQFNWRPTIVNLIDGKRMKILDMKRNDIKKHDGRLHKFITDEIYEAYDIYVELEDGYKDWFNTGCFEYELIPNEEGI